LENLVLNGKFIPLALQDGKLPALFRKKKKIEKNTELLDKSLLLQFIKVELGSCVIQANTLLILNQDDCKESTENTHIVNSHCREQDLALLCRHIAALISFVKHMDNVSKMIQCSTNITR